MRTSKPISTISFNTKEFLLFKLNELLRNKIISKWYFIEHLPEDDEGGKKTHFHVYVEPSKMIQTVDLRELFKEYDPTKPDKPKCTIDWHNSDFGNWYLYSIHDKIYLASKGESRKYHYTDDQIIFSDEDDLNFDIKSVDVVSKYGEFKQIELAIQRGQTFTEFVKNGKIPIPQIRNFEFVWNLLTHDKTYRNGHENHPSDNNEETPDNVIIDAVDYELDAKTGELCDKII